MPTLSSIAAFAGLASLAIAGPVEKRGTFSFTQSHRKNTTRTGAGALQKALLKFGVPVPDNVVKAAQVQGQATTTPTQFDSEYLTPVTVGGTLLNLDIDTGSSDLWVFSNELPANERAGHSFYTVSAAKKQAGETWDITFGDGSSARGDVYTDTVSVGGVTATTQTVQAAQSVSASFVSDTDTDGLMGLAFSTINTVRPRQATTFFDTVKSTLNSPVFAADLKFHAPGVYDFGFVDTTKFTGSLDFAAVSTVNGFWQFTASGFAVSGTRTNTAINGIADTGTTLLLLPASVVNAYYARVAGAQNSAAEGGIIFPCSATLPDFSLVINGNLHTVPGEFINFAPVSNTECFGGIQSDAGIGLAIFGDIFLKSQYVVFDETQASPRIGFGNQS